jgi:ArsR family transcriptional regulator
MYSLPMRDASYDAAILHNVLHFADDPGAALGEAARILCPGGRLLVVDFAPHTQEFLRREHAHRRLGFADAEMKEWFTNAGLTFAKPICLKGGSLTVVLWTATRVGNRGADLDDEAASSPKRPREQISRPETALLDGEKVT